MGACCYNMPMPDRNSEAKVSKKVSKYFSKYPLRSYPKGHILVFPDENPDYIFYLVKGRVKKYAISYREDEVVLNIFKPSTFFPMSWAINRSSNHYFYKTEEATELRVVPADDALEFIQANPDVLLDLMSRIYRGMDVVQGRLVHLMSGTAKSRLVYELIIDCRRFGIKGKNGSYEVDAAETDLAARTGLSRETVSREMQKLKAAEIVVIENNTINVLDIDALEHLLGKEI